MAGHPWRKPYEEALKAAGDGDPARARPLFDRAVGNGADHWHAFYGRAWADLQMGATDTDTVEGDLRKALELGGANCPDAAALLGRLRLDRGDSDEAFHLFLQAVGRSQLADLVERGLVEALATILDRLEEQDDQTEGPGTCDRLEALLRATSPPQLLYTGLLAEIVATRAFCLSRAGDEARAGQEFRRLTQLMPDHPRVPPDLRPTNTTAPAPSAGLAEPMFDDIGGRGVANSVQKKICDLFDRYFGDPDLEATRKRFEQFGQVPTRSLLLFGPSGCGKTYIIRAFAGEYRKRHGRDLPIHVLRLNEVMDKWVGETEKTLTRIFNEAIQSQPSILFADELDAIGGARDRGQDWRVSQTAHLLQELDRLRTQGAFVIFFGATNRIWAMELALLRRFDQLIPMEMPNDDVRASMLEVQLRRLNPAVRPTQTNLQTLAKATHGLTAGDIEKVVRLAVDGALGSAGADGRRVTEQDLLDAVAQYRKPMHVRDWFLRSRTALREAGHAEMADEVDRTYGPYVGDVTAAAPITPPWELVPDDAWREAQSYDLTVIRNLRRPGG